MTRNCLNVMRKVAGINKEARVANLYKSLRSVSDKLKRAMNGVSGAVRDRRVSGFRWNGLTRDEVMKSYRISPGLKWKADNDLKDFLAKLDTPIADRLKIAGQDVSKAWDYTSSIPYIFYNAFKNSNRRKVWPRPSRPGYTLKLEPGLEPKLEIKQYIIDQLGSRLGSIKSSLAHAIDTLYPSAKVNYNPKAGKHPRGVGEYYNPDTGEYFAKYLNR